jgi:hypothetical protein
MYARSPTARIIASGILSRSFAVASAGRPPSLAQSPMSPAPMTTCVGYTTGGGGGGGVGGSVGVTGAVGEPEHAAATSARSQRRRENGVLTSRRLSSISGVYCRPFPVQYLGSDKPFSGRMPAKTALRPSTCTVAARGAGREWSRRGVRNASGTPLSVGVSKTIMPRIGNVGGAALAHRVEPFVELLKLVGVATIRPLGRL